jgi:hypothetical protein
VADLTKRYGNLKGGASDIKTHRWFAEINWEALVDKKIPATYKPVVKYILFRIKKKDRRGIQLIFQLILILPNYLNLLKPRRIRLRVGDYYYYFQIYIFGKK